MLVETGEKIFCMSLDTSEHSGNISAPGIAETYTKWTYTKLHRNFEAKLNIHVMLYTHGHAYIEILIKTAQKKFSRASMHAML